MEDRTIRITLRRHDETGLLAAMSEDLVGLVVFGRTPEEIATKLPIAVRELLEALGYVVHSATVLPDNRASGAGFGLPAYIANASLVKSNDGRRV
jgi:hypothetical protein